MQLPILTGRKVLVIGNSELNDTPDLDQYIVLRINKGGEQAIKSGQRCDIWLNNLSYSKTFVPDFIPVCTIMRMNYEYGGRRAFKFPKEWENITWRWGSRYYEQMVKSLEIPRPSSGLMVLWYLISKDIDTSIIGFDGYKTKNRYTGHTGEGDPHDWKREQEIIHDWITEGKIH